MLKEATLRLPLAAVAGAVVALTVAAWRPFVGAPTVAAVAMIGATPLFAFAALPPDPWSGGGYPAWRWATIYAATVIPIALAALLVGSISAPSRLGTLDGRSVVIASIGGALLAWLPWVPWQRGTLAALGGVGGMVLAGGMSYVWFLPLLGSEPELVLAFGWVIGTGIGGLVRGPAPLGSPPPDRLPATATVRTMLSMVLAAVLIGSAVFVDWAIRRPS